MKRKLQIHALATDKGDLIYFSNTKEWKYGKGEQRNEYAENRPHHLYLTDNSPIQEGDWAIDLLANDIFRAGKFENWPADLKAKIGKHTPKIVATTDSTLWVKEPFGYDGLAKIPVSLIQAFANSQGKLKEVMVEYEEAHYDWINNPNGTRIQNKVKEEQLKFNLDGTIIWSPVEERMYTKEYIIQKIEEIHPGIVDKSKNNPFIYRSIENWYNELKQE